MKVGEANKKTHTTIQLSVATRKMLNIYKMDVDIQFNDEGVKELLRIAGYAVEDIIKGK
jgi:hypothetical protein